MSKKYTIKPLSWKVETDDEDILILICQTIIGFYQIDFVKQKKLIKDFGFKYQLGFSYKKYWDISSIKEGKRIAKKHYLQNLLSALQIEKLIK